MLQQMSMHHIHGLTPSVLAGSGSIEVIMDTFEKSSHGFMLETDYMDDLRRPGAVLGPNRPPTYTSVARSRIG